MPRSHSRTIGGLSITDKLNPHEHHWRNAWCNDIGITCPNCGAYTRDVEVDEMRNKTWHCEECGTYWSEAQLLTWIIDYIKVLTASACDSCYMKDLDFDDWKILYSNEYKHLYGDLWIHGKPDIESEYPCEKCKFNYLKKKRPDNYKPLTKGGIIDTGDSIRNNGSDLAIILNILRTNNVIIRLDPGPIQDLHGQEGQEIYETAGIGTGRV